MLELPIELQRLCLDNLKDKGEALKSLLLENKRLSTMATKILFQKATLYHTKQSAEKFMTLMQSSMNSLVRHVVLNASYDPDDSGSDDYDNDDSKIKKSFISAMATIHSFPNLGEVEMQFSSECAVQDGVWRKDVLEDDSFRIEVLDLLFTAMRKAENVRSFTIQNLQDHHDDKLFGRDDFAVVRGRLTKLHLQITNEYETAAPECNIEKEAFHEGFTNALPNIWLKPTVDQLTHLTLYATDYVGMWPFIDFREIPTFPHLQSLSLGNLTLLHDWQIDWIVSHSSTLQELLLDDCPIITTLKLDENQVKPNFPDAEPYETSQYGTWYFVHVPLRWHHVFDRFRSQLLRLNRFTMGHGDWLGERAFQQRYELSSRYMGVTYCMFDSGIGPSSWVEFDAYGPENCHNFDHEEVTFLVCKEEDQTALLHLSNEVQARASIKI
jgi:hypothetical protein